MEGLILTNKKICMTSNGNKEFYSTVVVLRCETWMRTATVSQTREAFQI